MKVFLPPRHLWLLASPFVAFNPLIYGFSLLACGFRPSHMRLPTLPHADSDLLVYGFQTSHLRFSPPRLRHPDLICGFLTTPLHSFEPAVASLLAGARSHLPARAKNKTFCKYFSNGNGRVQWFYVELLHATCYMLH